MRMSSLVERDLRVNWHPCTQMADHQDFPPLVVTSARGVWLHLENGGRLLDGISSWWVNLFGHCHPRLLRVLADQASRLDHCMFASLTHPWAVELSERLTALSGLHRVFYADNGSSAVELAMKMAYHYQVNLGHPERKLFAHLSGSYHGETLGALSVGDLGLYGEPYRGITRRNLRLEGPNCVDCSYGGTRSFCSLECLKRDVATLEAAAPEVCAVIVEPLVQGAAGMRMYPAGYFRGLREAAGRLGILFIDDEIAMGFGRTGRIFAYQHAGVVPDLVCLSKGITGGMMPFSAVLATEGIYQAFYGGGLERAFLHSHSYCGNPLGCALGIEVLKMLEDMEVTALVGRLGDRLVDLMERYFRPFRYTWDIRSLGLVGAVELRRPDGSLLPPQMRLGRQIGLECMRRGVLLRPLGDVIYFLPPYVIGEDELELMVRTACQAAERVLEGADL
ncbi:adenosylmethionine-8-amino-7-oxononanoateaminotr ansferase [Thermanaerovibrio acidaminovorans DSM 6589]|uniref:Adenosylmethionine-8-amino-7-oxononanoate aminotransferase n=2 Tax=Thermanaerovibrio TaxID=81461 RepID=D1B881_THEAS|nr:adenosylmethionine-8-amino-7-oxononanoateaminotr ansferase [Thermanaerovibrio acidaminovorans DSM 6589]